MLNSLKRSIVRYFYEFFMTELSQWPGWIDREAIRNSLLESVHVDYAGREAFKPDGNRLSIRFFVEHFKFECVCEYHSVIFIKIADTIHSDGIVRGGKFIYSGCITGGYFDFSINRISITIADVRY